MMNDVIVAISTASLNAAISIVRMSGKGSKEIVEQIFVSKTKLESRRMTYGFIADHRTNQKIDEVMAVYLPAPGTYTREDVVEINCHGGQVSAQRILELIVGLGARIAERGEFTLRAFLNGRIDLAQAESVVDLVKAKTVKAFDCSLNQLGGAMSVRVKHILTQLIDLIADITVSIDYPEEDIEEVSLDRIRTGIGLVIREIEALLKNAEHSRLIRDGAKVAIVGKPNVGKSSLMNLLLGEVRVIVTDVPGTTRDTIEEVISIEGYPVRLIDTAGIRETEDFVEKIGIEKTKIAANSADIILLILDASRDLDEDDFSLLEHFSDRNLLIVANKSDLPSAWEVSVLPEQLRGNVLLTAVKNGGDRAVQNILARIAALLKRGIDSDDVLVNARHQQILNRSREVLENALHLQEYDLVEVDLRDVVALLGEITGDRVRDDILNAVFSKFCLGK